MRISITERVQLSMGLGSRIIGTVLIVGAGALAVAAIVAAPRVLVAARPTVREALRRGLGFYERARHAAAEFVEDVEDLVAEVQADLNEKEVSVPQASQGAEQA